MKGTKTQKGITLVALIITIVVLLILAVVAIIEIGDTGIIAHAENSAKTYNNSVKNEADILGGYLDYLENARRCEICTFENGVCTVCGYRCPHEEYEETWDEETYASIAVCKTCAYTCRHTGEINMIIAPDEWNKMHSNLYICDVCQTLIRGEGPFGCCMFRNSEGNCSECGNVGVAHTWNGGSCTTCGVPDTYCLHNEGLINEFTNGICDVCGLPCTHAPAFVKDGVCEACGYVCEHTSGFNEGKCMVCGFACTHGEYIQDPVDPNIHCCTVCMNTYPHTGIENGGVCEGCGYVCEHTNGFNEGKCMVCGYECQHNNLIDDAVYSNYDENYHYYPEVCMDCMYYTGKTNKYSHDFYDGYCGRCGYTCVHPNPQVKYEGHSKNDLVYEGQHAVLANCTNCGTNNIFLTTEQCTTYENGKCTKCQEACPHYYGFTDGECNACGYECQHNNLIDDAVCSNYDENYHYYLEVCGDCMWYTGKTNKYEHDFWDGYCMRCGYQQM